MSERYYTVADVLSALLELVATRRRHFRLESGHHASVWLDLDPLFSQPRRVAPFVRVLTDALRPYSVAAICGPLLGGAFLAQLVANALDVDFGFTERIVPSEQGGLYRAEYRMPAAIAQGMRGKRIAIVDDVMSAGSALRGTCIEAEACGAIPVVAGALLVLGTTGAELFAVRGVPVVAAVRDRFELWPPETCPLCRNREPLQNL